MLRDLELGLGARLLIISRTAHPAWSKSQAGTRSDPLQPSPW